MRREWVGSRERAAFFVVGVVGGVSHASLAVSPSVCLSVCVSVCVLREERRVADDCPAYVLPNFFLTCPSLPTQ